MYAGERETTQYQSIPMAPQLNPSHAGGVITLQRHYQGIDSRWTHRGELGVPVTFTTGLNYENMSENRKGYCATAPCGLIPTTITLLRVTAMTAVMPVITNGYQPDR